MKFPLNAGGLNPHGAATALAELFRKKGWRARIAVVTGDDVIDRVRISGASGKPRLASLKIVGGYQDGWMGQASFGYSWPQAYQKARRSAEIIPQLMAEQGIPTAEMRVEYLGYDSILGPLADPAQRENLNEVYLRMAIRSDDKRIADGFGRQFPWLVLSGPPFVGGRFGLQAASELLGIWPTLAARGLIERQVNVNIIEA